MKGSSAPCINGFTVNWLRMFWDSLKLVTYNAINECYEEESLTSPLKTGFVCLLGTQEGAEGPDTYQKLQTNFAPVILLQACLVLYHPEAPPFGR